MSTATTFGVSGGPPADSGYGDGTAAARRREELRDFGSRLSDDWELRTCGVKIRKGRVGSSTEILEVTKSCRRKWLCPTCGYTAWWKEAAKLKRRLRGWTAQGGAVALLTLTQSHSLDDSLALLWDRLEDGWASLVRGSGWIADKHAHGVRAYVRVTELVHNPAAGWHVHFHVVLLLDRDLDQLALDELRVSLAARFARGVARRGGHAALGGQHLQPMAPGTEGALANYLFKGTTIGRDNDGSSTPMAILDHLECTDEGQVLWDELATAVSAQRRMQVITSRHIDSLCTAPGTTLDRSGSDSTNSWRGREVIQLTTAQPAFRTTAISSPQNSFSATNRTPRPCPNPPARCPPAPHSPPQRRSDPDAGAARTA